MSSTPNDETGPDSSTTTTATSATFLGLHMSSVLMLATILAIRLYTSCDRCTSVVSIRRVLGDSRFSATSTFWDRRTSGNSSRSFVTNTATSFRSTWAAAWWWWWTASRPWSRCLFSKATPFSTDLRSSPSPTSGKAKVGSSLELHVCLLKPVHCTHCL